MKKKIIALALVLCLAAVAVVGGTLAYFTDVADATNTFTVGNVDIELTEPNWEETGKEEAKDAYPGEPLAKDPKVINEVAVAVKKATSKPVMIKLSPNVTDIVEMALAAEQGGADCVSLINTLTGMAIDINTRRPVLANLTGGMSGPAVRPIALRMCYQVAQAVNIPVVGMGGIMTGEDAVMFLLAGCTAVQVGTANLSDPMACPKIIEGLEQYMVKNGVAKVSELIGAIITD